MTQNNIESRMQKVESTINDEERGNLALHKRVKSLELAEVKRLAIQGTVVGGCVIIAQIAVEVVKHYIK